MNRSIVVLMADQLGAHALGEDHIDAPWLRMMAERGVNYEHAYCSFPLCTPSRSSMMTGLMPHEMGVMGNQHDRHVGRSPHSLGHWFREHGYATVWAGKYHTPGPDGDPESGFDVIHPFGDHGLAEAIGAWLGDAPSDRPFLLVASWDDPHSICEFARGQHQPYGDVAPRPVRDCPPLPVSHSLPIPEALANHKATAAHMYGTNGYTTDDWRRYRDAYGQLVERIDDQWSRLWHQLEAMGVTVVITSDHGDGDAAHGWNQKTALFQECIRVPLIIAGPAIEAESVGRAVNMSTGLLGSLCRLAGIPRPPGVPDWERDEPVVVETRFSTGSGWTDGRAVVDPPWKYVVYAWGREREQLFNLDDDPGETRNLALESRFDDQLERCRRTLFEWCERTGDTAMLRKLIWPAEASARTAELFDPPY
ncbi:sulfatase family protein [Tessaracoccus oleiagri]|uniref:Choline-sulfatase n=1 Tax=Tessaracoccus oleiagri TaxID=686624 RepID=A0A1G9N114_9ACTN|nr:sulfatase-like hydrolase/transferase [Tessaracoccus oleiagri]SDL80246.1 choline-sulfatase [Tessaracoccus oleiagri]